MIGDDHENPPRGFGPRPERCRPRKVTPLRDRGTGRGQRRMGAVPEVAPPPRVMHQRLRAHADGFVHLRAIPLRRERAAGVASPHRALAKIMRERRVAARIDIPHAIPQGIEPRARPAPIAIAGRHEMKERIESALRHIRIALKIPCRIEQRRRHHALRGRPGGEVAERRELPAERPADRGEVVGGMKIGRRIEPEGRSGSDVIEQRIPRFSASFPVPDRIEQEMGLEALPRADCEIVGCRVPALSGDLRVGNYIPAGVEDTTAQNEMASPGPSDPEKNPDERGRTRSSVSLFAPLRGHAHLLFSSGRLLAPTAYAGKPDRCDPNCTTMPNDREIASSRRNAGRWLQNAS